MILKKLFVAIVIFPVLGGCAAKPQDAIQTISTADPKFNSPECLDIRSRAVTYNNRVGERVGVGLALGVLTGPIGLPIAAAMDADANSDRVAFNREIELRCMTNPPARTTESVASAEVKETRRKTRAYGNFAGTRRV